MWIKERQQTLATCLVTNDDDQSLTGSDLPLLPRDRCLVGFSFFLWTKRESTQVLLLSTRFCVPSTFSLMCVDSWFAHPPPKLVSTIRSRSSLAPLSRTTFSTLHERLLWVYTSLCRSLAGCYHCFVYMVNPFSYCCCLLRLILLLLLCLTEASSLLCANLDTWPWLLRYTRNFSSPAYHRSCQRDLYDDSETISTLSTVGGHNLVCPYRILFGIALSPVIALVSGILQMSSTNILYHQLQLTPIE